MLVSTLVSIALPIIVVLGHLWLLRLLSWGLNRFDGRPRLAIALSIMGAIIGHICEITLFAAGFALLISIGNGEVGGVGDGSFDDLVYFSSVTYTSLGYGDMVPLGKLRTLALVEAITGILMIAWTGSFTFVQMQKRWEAIKGRK